MIINASKCKGCGNIAHRDSQSADFYNSFPRYVCRECGKNRAWIDVIIKVESLSIWWNPKTWNTEKVEEL
jgi:hypothetical protein